MPHAAKLEVLERRFQVKRLQGPRPQTGKRVQKNLTILESDAARLKALAARAKVSQARLLGLALDAYERSSGEYSIGQVPPSGGAG